MHRHLPLSLFPLLAMVLLASCGVPPVDAVRDLAAIHSKDHWRPVSPADMTVSPEVYLGDQTARRLGAGNYEIADHRTLELAILKQLNTVDPANPGDALETASWLLVELTQDDYGGARIQAAKILSNLAGIWISREGAQLVDEDPSENLPEALRQLQEAPDAAALSKAATRLSHVAFPDSLTALRVLTALGRRADTRSYADNGSNGPIYSLALKLVMIGLEEGTHSAEEDVARACQERYDLLLSYARG